MIIGWEFFVSFIICLAYFIMAFTSGVERGMLSFTMASLYSVFILSLTNFYYSRFNFIWCFVSSLTSFAVTLNSLWVVLGGVLGSIVAVIFYQLFLKPSVKEDVEKYLVK